VWAPSDCTRRHPEVLDEAARKRLFKEEFPKFFGRDYAQSDAEGVWQP
jgi:hypothetical protein